MSEFPYLKELPINRDVQGIVAEYLRGSRPIYRQWSIKLYNQYLGYMLKSLPLFIDDEKLYDILTDLFEQVYGLNIGELIDSTQPIHELILTMGQEIAHLFDTEFTDQSSSNIDLIIFLFNLWAPYQSKFYKYVYDDKVYLYNPLDKDYHQNPEIINKINQALNLGLDPFETNPINSLSFFELLIHILNNDEILGPLEKDYINISQKILNHPNFNKLHKLGVKGYSSHPLIQFISIGNSMNIPYPSYFFERLSGMLKYMIERTDFSLISENDQFQLLKYIISNAEPPELKLLLSILKLKNPQFDLNVKNHLGKGILDENPSQFAKNIPTLIEFGLKQDSLPSFEQRRSPRRSPSRSPRRSPSRRRTIYDDY